MQEHCSIIGKLLSGINRKQFKRSVDKYNGDKYVKYFNCWSQFVCIFIGQIGNFTSIREIVDAVNFQPQNLLKITDNNMFYTLKPRDYGRKRYKDPNQLKFQWVFD